MIVISDTSPISNLLQINKLNLLKTLFEEIIIPPAVHQEIIALENLGEDIIAYKNATWMKIIRPKIQKRSKNLR